MTIQLKEQEGSLLKTDSLGRVTIPVEKREQILDSFEQSAMSAAAFATLHGVHVQTFASWIQKRRRARGDYDDPEIRRKLRMGKNASVQKRTTKQPTEKKSSAVSSTQYNFIELNAEPNTQITTEPVEVILTNGVIVKFSSAAQISLLRVLIKELSC